MQTESAVAMQKAVINENNRSGSASTKNLFVITFKAMLRLYTTQ